MNLNYELAMAINDILVSNEMREKTTIFNPLCQEFTQEELASITELKLCNVSSLDDLNYLPNLKTLKIVSGDYNEIIPELDYNESAAINHIKDFEQLSTLKKLEQLEIVNDLYIEHLDVSNLKNLKILKLINNINLREIVGLEDKKCLTNVLMYGNPFNCNFDIFSYMKNTIMAKQNVLDINLYLNAIKFDKDLAKRLMEMEIAGFNNVLFAEKSGFLDYTTCNSSSLQEMFTKLWTFFKKTGVNEYDDDMKCNFIYNYILNNIKCSMDDIEWRNESYNNLIKQYGLIPEQLIQSLNSMHGSYRTYKFKYANCEGIANLVVFMMKMLGIDAYNVHCVDKRSHLITGANHSIIRINFEKPLYMDPSYDRKKADKYFLLNFDEISNYHNLDSFEYSIRNGLGGKQHVK